MALNSQIDAGFYNLIHQLSGSGRWHAVSERRDIKRQPFSSVQRIALRRGPDLPDDSEFVEVHCHDLTRQGFSFFLPSRPSFDTLVAAFGSPPEIIYLAARVSHWEDVAIDAAGRLHYLDRQSDGQRQTLLAASGATGMVLVGCRFTERLLRHAERAADG